LGTIYFENQLFLDHVSFHYFTSEKSCTSNAKHSRSVCLKVEISPSKLYVMEIINPFVVSVHMHNSYYISKKVVRCSKANDGQRSIGFEGEGHILG
jgi:hypothetical protein